MLKNISNLGKQLSKAAQKQVIGGTFQPDSNTGYMDSFNGGDSITDNCDTNDDCGNYTNPHTGNYCQIICRSTASGNRCMHDAC